MRSLFSRVGVIAWSALLALLILVFGQGVWEALLVANLRTSTAVPWAAPVMIFVLWLMWQYLGGRWWPYRTADARRRFLRANLVARETFAWSLVAGVLSIAASAGYWIVMFQLVKMPPNVLPDLSKYPFLTVALLIVTASLVSPITEEAAFRGYAQVILEKEFSGPAAVVISSVLFALAHGTHGFLWPKLLVYFLVGVVFGVTAYFTNSTLPAIPVHIMGDVTFFTLVWPYDRARQLVWESGTDNWFWIHGAQAVIFTALALLAFQQLGKVTERRTRVLMARV